MIRKSRRRRVREFPHPAIRGAADFVVLGVTASPYPIGSERDTFYRLGFVLARDRLANGAILPFQEFLDHVDRIYTLRGKPVEARKPARRP